MFNIDLIVVMFFLGIILSTGFVFKKLGRSSSSNYFRGGGRMLWWMVGSTIFMTQFSAWTFTGAAAKGYTDGLMVIAVFVGNVVGFYAAYKYFAAKYRQTRVDTGGEIIRKRFGSKNEQFFTWLTVPMSVVSGGLWLNSLAIFVSLVLKVDVVTTIWLTGAAVIFVSLLGGAWGVVATDFVQSLIVAVVSVMCAIVALYQVGGPGVIISDFPGGFVYGPDMNYGMIFIGTFLFFLVKQIQTNNSMFNSYRFLAAKDSKNASKGAMLALVLMVFGTIIWFIPPWATAILYPDAGTHYAPQLANRSKEAVYLIFAERSMPAGTVGIIIACLFAATMSSMDSALNRDSGIIVKSFYKAVLKPKATDRELLLVGNAVCLLIGLLVILTALFYHSLKGLSLFDLAMQVGTIAQAPMLVPLFFGVFYKKTPDWSGYATVLFGILVSYLITTTFTVQNMAAWAGLEFTGREFSELRTMWNIFAHLVFTGGFFFLTGLFYKEPTGERKEVLEEYYKDLDTEVNYQEDLESDEYDSFQRRNLGKIVLVSATGMLLLALINNPMWGRFVFVASAAILAGIGFILYKGSFKNVASKQLDERK